MFLAVTGLKEGIDETEKIIMFCEEGCLKNEHDGYDYFVMPKPYKSVEDIREYIRYTRKSKEKILKILGDGLNEFHEIDLDIKQWDRLLYFWLDFYIETMYIKYITIKYAADNYYIYTYGLKESSYIHPAFKYGYWIWGLFDEKYNFQLYTNILKYLGIEIRKYVDVKGEKEVLHHQLKKKREKLVNTVLVNPHNFNLNFVDKLELKIKTLNKIKFVNCIKEDSVSYEYNAQMRKKLLLKSEGLLDEFELMLLKTIPMDLPTVYLEGFSERNSTINIHPQKIISAEDMAYFEKVSFMVATNKCKLYTFLIGGDGNIYYGNNEAYMNSQLSDVIYTSGWNYRLYNCEMRKATNPRFAKGQSVVKKKKKEYDILYIGTGTFLYRYLLFNILSLYSKEYICDSISFLQKISKESNLSVKARFFNGSRGWEINRMLRDQKVNFMLDDYKNEMIVEAQNCRLCVVDSFGTPWAEILSMDIPLIIIVPEYLENFSDDGERIVDKLKSVGVCQSSYDEAINYIIQNIQSIEAWWNDKNRREVVRKIRNEYVYVSNNPKREWKDEFIKIANKSDY